MLMSFFLHFFYLKMTERKDMFFRSIFTTAAFPAFSCQCRYPCRCCCIFGPKISAKVETTQPGRIPRILSNSLSVKQFNL